VAIRVDNWDAIPPGPVDLSMWRVYPFGQAVSFRLVLVGPQCLEAGRVPAAGALSHLGVLARPQGAAA
jgi:hypothetical protein